MRKSRFYYFPLILFLLLLAGGYGLRVLDSRLPATEFSVKRVERVVQNVRAEMKDFIDQIPLSSLTSHRQMWQSIDSLGKKPFKLLIYQGYELVGWNSHLLPVDGINPHYFKQDLVRLENGWYLTMSKQEGDILIVAFSLLRAEYLYQNQFLKNGYPKEYGLDAAVMISREAIQNGFAINDADGDYLFSLIPGGTLAKKTSVVSIISDIFILLSLAVLWILLYYFQKRQFRVRRGVLAFLSSSVVFSFFYYMLIWKSGIHLFDRAGLFSPEHFAMSELLPSLGHFMLISLLLFSLSFWFLKFFRLPITFKEDKHSRLRQMALLLLFLLGASFYLVFISKLFYMLAQHSSGDLVLIKIIELDAVVIVRYLSISLLLLSFLFIMERICLRFLISLPRWQVFAVVAFVVLANIFLFKGLGVGDSDWAFLFFLAIAAVLIFSRRNPESGLSYSSFSWIAALFAIYVGMVFMDMTIRKEESNREFLLENLSFQLMRDEDPIAEIYLSEIEKQISNDVTLMRLMAQPEIDADIIRNHLMKFYFYGYWGRFDMQIIPCWPQGDLYIEEANELRNCYSYFFEMLENYGYAINGSTYFHYLDNNNGRVSYFGIFRFFPNDAARETSLFIELHSKPFFEGLGYPELLVSDRDRTRMGLLYRYSHAKYLNGRLVKRSGEFIYKSDASHYKPVLHSKVFLKEGAYSHLVYQPSADVTILLSREDYSVYDVFMAFSLFFLFFFLLNGIIVLLLQWQSKGFSFNLSIQKRIQTAFIAVLLIMLVVVAIGTVYYTVNQFHQKHLELLESKVQSILLELEYKIGIDGPETSSPEGYLNYQLQMISNVFYCDINLFGVDGNLIGTSRPELFRNGLAGNQINPEAYYNLAYTEAVSHLDEEQIGGLSYISFYVPLLGNDSRLTGFLNLPYFVGNNELRDEISSVIVTIVNFYIIFSFLAVILAVFLSRQITRPLLLLQNKISQIKLDRLNEKIDYKAEDEIGELVAEYNWMVDELTISAGKLAKTERDLAWREMAKQIAHEIKNPLTPMKLSVQYLQRAWNDKVEDFDSYLQRVTQTLIEQINSLSSIASEFSKFAQMPVAKAEEVNLIDKIENCRTLFGEAGEVPIALHNHAGNAVMVKADGEQLLGVFNNLIKNAIQSIPNTRKGKIDISVNTSDGKVIVAVKDNGKGVPEAIRDNLFVPSFTTKTGGMGLGLAITRRVVENAGGRIWFDTQEDRGSVFYVELPYAAGGISSLE